MTTSKLFTTRASCATSLETQLMAVVNKTVRKSMEIRFSGRSTDYISPSFGFGCLFNCTYCYMKRHGKEGVGIATNTETILQHIDMHANFFADVEKPNQTHPEFITYDISCNEDFALHAKYHDWERIFSFFRDHPTASASMATKHIPKRFLDFDPQGKVRIRFSLMPQRISSIVEPKTSLILDRIQAIDTFIEAGYDVHVNFSPVILYDTWEEDYRELFRLLDSNLKYHDRVQQEVIFLTHNEKKHMTNLADGLGGENLLWNPDLQEAKRSQFGGENVRYKRDLKRVAIDRYKTLVAEEIPWCNIRYIF